jgi:photosystem II stability/assembly factor-like uncharacterized protein
MKKASIAVFLIMFLSSAMTLPFISTAKYFVKGDGGYTWLKSNNGLFGGNVYCISIDPKDNDRIYVGTDNGVYRSMDRGSTWNITDLTNISVYSIQIDPTNTEEIYAGATNGIYASINYGEDWLNIGKSTGRITALAIDPLDSKNIYATLCGGVYIKRGTEQWVNISGNLTNRCINTISINPSDPTNIFVGCSNTFDSQGQWEWGGLFVTKNGGTNWTQIAKDSIKGSVNSIVFHPNNSNIIYVGTENGVFKSVDGGVTFSDINSGLKFDSSDISNTIVNSIAISPRDNQVVYAGTNKGLFKSANGGLNWAKIDLESRNNYIESVALSSQDPETVYAGTHGSGILKSFDGINWTLSNNGLDAVIIESLGIDINNCNVIYAGTNGDGLFRSTDGGQNWFPINNGLILGVDNNSFYPLVVYSIVKDYKDSQTIYLATSKGIFKSTNGGEAWTPKNTGLTTKYVNSIIIDPLDNRIIYAGTDDFLFKSTDGGENWTRLNSSGFSKQYSGNILVYSIAINSNNPQSIYLGTSEGLLRSIDNGLSWTRLSLSSSIDSVYCVTVSISSQNIVYANTSTSIFKSLDGGSNWKKLTGFANISGFTDMSINSILVDPKDSNTLYVATNHGIFQSKDSGNNWINLGLQLSAISAIVLSPLPYRIYGGTGNNGVYAYLPMDTEAPTIKIYSPLDESKVYQNTIQLTGLVTDNVGVASLFIGSSKVNFAPDGTFKVSIELSEGENLIKITAYDLSGNRAESTIKVLYLKDTTIPNLQINYPSNNSTVDKETIILRGKAIDNESGLKSVAVNGNEVSVNSDGSFESATSLLEGTNEIDITATDIAGNKNTFTLHIIYKKPLTTIALTLRIGNSAFTVNGETRYLDSPPIIKNGRTLVPIRAIVEALGGTVQWNPNENGVDIILGSNHLILQIGNPNAYVNGVQKFIDASNMKVYPEIINGRTMIPLRFVAENLGCDVQWDPNTQTITITYRGY